MENQFAMEMSWELNGKRYLDRNYYWEFASDQENTFVGYCDVIVVVEPEPLALAVAATGEKLPLAEAAIFVAQTCTVVANAA